MIPLILGFGSAALFLGLSTSVYGAGVLMEGTWVALVFYGLMASGVAVTVINRPMPAWLCRLLERVKAPRQRLGAPAPCGC
jgi:hypothetical protein